MFKLKLHPNEKPQELIRQTEIVLAKPSLIILLAVYIPWFFLLKYELVGHFYRLLITWTVLLLLYGIYKYVIWLLNVNVITNRRIINFDYKNLFHKKVTETALERIANVGFTTKGLFASLFKYGTVEIHLIGTQQSISLPRVRHPEAVKDLLWAAREKTSGTVGIQAQKPKMV